MARRTLPPITNRNMRLFKSNFDNNPDMKSLWRDAELSTDELILETLNEVKRNMLRFLRSYTNVSRPGDYRAQFGPLMEGKKAPDRNKVEWKEFAKWWNIPRPTHPGGWADITGELMAAYESEVQRLGPADYILTLDNSSEHAKYVEAMSGLFVVDGVLAAGGYVHRSIEKTFAYLGRKWVTGPRGGRKLGPNGVVVSANDEGISVTGTP